jgi:hypothetical protein
MMTGKRATEKAATDILLATVPILMCENNGKKRIVCGEIHTFTSLAVKSI